MGSACDVQVSTVGVGFGTAVMPFGHAPRATSGPLM